MSTLDHQIELIQKLFKCREDVFAIRWEKGNKKGYMGSPTIFGSDDKISFICC